MRKMFRRPTFFILILNFSLLPVFADLFHPLNLVHDHGSTIPERIEVPFKFKRVKTEQGSFAEYIRNYPLKNADCPLLLFNSRKKENQEAHAAIFSLPVENQEFQNSSGSIIKLYAEYKYKNLQEDQLSFHLINGSEFKWTDWLEKSKAKRELRTDIAGNLKKWTEYENPQDKRKVFDKYLKNILSNTDILSMQIYDSEPTTFEDIQIGDILMDMANHKHVCLVVDICINPETMEKAVLLAQGNSPAQEFHIIKNPKRENDPWYHEEDFMIPAQTPEYVFPKDSWRKLNYR